MSKYLKLPSSTPKAGAAPQEVVKQLENLAVEYRSVDGVAYQVVPWGKGNKNLRRKVMLGSPSHSGQLDVEYAMSVINAIRACAEENIDLIPVWVSFDALVQRARNDLVRLAVESKVDDLLMVDTDQIFTEKQVLRILSHKVDCVGAAVPKKSEKEERYNVRSSTVNIPVNDRNGLMVVDGVGTGFLRLTKHALVTIWASSEEYEDNGRKSRMVFDVKVLNGILCGEDILFCAKLHKLGFDIHLDPTFTVDHVGRKVFQGDFSAYLSALVAGKEAK